MSDSSVLVESQGAILRITLNRPERRNAVDLPMARGLAAALDRLDDDPDLMVGVIEGAGTGFCAGVDIDAFTATGELPSVEGRGFLGISERSSRKPLIAAVEGFAVAGGLEIALACDLIVASNRAIVGLPEVRRGMAPAGGGIFRLTRRVSLGVALELVLTGQPIGTVRAERVGLIDRLVAPGRAFEEATALAEAIAVGAPLAVQSGKALLHRGWNLGEAEFRAMTDELADPLLESEDAAEGLRAFVQKRAPRWAGR